MRLGKIAKKLTYPICKKEHSYRLVVVKTAPQKVTYKGMVTYKIPFHKGGWDCCSEECQKKYLQKIERIFLRTYICYHCKRKLGPILIKTPTGVKRNKKSISYITRTYSKNKDSKEIKKRLCFECDRKHSKNPYI